MKKCLNCNNIIRENDKYCRTCGIKIQNNSWGLIINIALFIMSIAITLLVILFVLSYYV